HDRTQTVDTDKPVAVAQDVSRPGASSTTEGSVPTAEIEGTSATTTLPSPAEARAAWREGVSLYDRGDYRGAAERLTVAARGRSDSAYTHYLLGLSLWKSGQIALSEKELTRSAELQPGALKTLVNLARVRMEQDDADGALSASESALAIDPASAAAMHQKGRALAALHRTDDAMTVLIAAHEQHP